jgi:xyloglucan-specific endo-beta-1,4-glucanase
MLSTLRALTFLLAPTSVLFVATALAVGGSPPIGVGLVPRQIDTLCEQYEWVTAGDFSLGTDFWGEASATSGSQCVYLDWDNGGNAISWQTSYTWEGDGSSVKSYANAGLTMEATQLSSISSMLTSWSWR